MVRKIMVVLLLVLFVLPVVGQEGQLEPKRTTSVALNESRLYDFGTIKEQAGKVTHRFRFTNKGRRPIAISNASAWCGCTSAAYTKQPIRPGGQGFVDVTFNPNYRPGKFVKEVVVYLNGGSEYFTLRVRGYVVGYRHPVTEEQPYAFGRGLYMSHRLLPFGGMRAGESFSFLLRVANDTDKPMTVTFKRVPDNRVLKMKEKVVLKPYERRPIQVSYTFPRSYAYDRHITLRVFVNGHEVKSLPVKWFGSKNILHMP